MSKPLRGLSLVWILGLAFWVPSYGQDLSYELTIKDHRFEPLELQVPAGKRFKLVVKNLDPTAEEFESHARKGHPRQKRSEFDCQTAQAGDL